MIAPHIAHHIFWPWLLLGFFRQFPTSRFQSQIFPQFRVADSAVFLEISVPNFGKVAKNIDLAHVVFGLN